MSLTTIVPYNMASATLTIYSKWRHCHLIYRPTMRRDAHWLSQCVLCGLDWSRLRSLTDARVKLSAMKVLFVAAACFCCYFSSAGSRNFHLGAIAQGVPSPSGIQEPSPGIGGQKLEQFADIVYTFWQQKRSEFETFARFTSWFLTCMFHGGAKWHLSPLAQPMPAGGRQCQRRVPDRPIRSLARSTISSLHQQVLAESFGPHVEACLTEHHQLRRSFTD